MRAAVISSLSCFVSVHGMYGATSTSNAWLLSANLSNTSLNIINHAFDGKAASNARPLSANASNAVNTYGSLKSGFVALNVLHFLEYDDCLEVGLCAHAMKHVFDDKVNGLFGLMFDVLLNNVPGYGLYTKSILEETLKNMPSCTYKQIKTRANYIDLRLFQQFRFIRGIDANTDLPFLAFALTTDIKYTKQDTSRTEYVVAIFNESAIHSVLGNNANDFYDQWYACNNSQFDIQTIISLLIDGKTYNKFDVENSIWMHLSDGTRNTFYKFHWLRKGFLCYASICFIAVFVIVYSDSVVSTDVFWWLAGAASFVFNIVCVVQGISARSNGYAWTHGPLLDVVFALSQILLINIVENGQKACFLIQIFFGILLIILRCGTY